MQWLMVAQSERLLSVTPRKSMAIFRPGADSYEFEIAIVLDAIDGLAPHHEQKFVK